MRDMDRWPSDAFECDGGLMRFKFIPLPRVASGKEFRKVSAGGLRSDCVTREGETPVDEAVVCRRWT